MQGPPSYYHGPSIVRGHYDGGVHCPVMSSKMTPNRCLYSIITNHTVPSRAIKENHTRICPTTYQDQGKSQTLPLRLEPYNEGQLYVRKPMLLRAASERENQQHMGNFVGLQWIDRFQQRGRLGSVANWGRSIEMAP